MASVVVLDTKSGQTITDRRFDEWWWAEGNGSCDCNRATLFGLEHPDDGCCLGCKRFLIVSVDGKPSGPDLNSDYPAELIARHLQRSDP
jgi:hypothetical protein